MPETQIDHWVDLHWQCAAAMLEAGVMDEKGEWIEGKDWRRGLEAYRERLLASPTPEAAAVGNDPFDIDTEESEAEDFLRIVIPGPPGGRVVRK
jgi:hypothetical protein